MVYNTVIRKWANTALVLAVILLPWLVTLILTRAVLGTPLTLLTPVRSDELVYWHEINTFRAVGFDGGYYTIQEQPAPAAFSHFYNHGPAFPALMGTLSRLLPWRPYTMVLFNLLFVSLALALFIRLTRPTTRGLVVLGVCLLTFHPLWMYTSWTMQETFHQACGIVLAALVYWILRGDSQRQVFSPSPRSRGRGDRGVRGLLLLFITAIALVRVTWALLLIPAALIVTRESKLSVRLAALIAAGLTITGLGALAQWWNAPFPLWFIVELRGQFAVSIRAGLRALVDHARDNLDLLPQGNPLWLAVRCAMIGLTLLFCCILLGKFIGFLTQQRKDAKAESILSMPPRLCAKIHVLEAAFHVLNLGLALAVNLLLYDILDFRDYRVFAPHLLLSLLLLIAYRRWTPVLLIALANLLLVTTFVTTTIEQRQPESLLDQSMSLRARNLYIRQLVEGHLAYDPDAATPWCNTLLSDDFSVGLIAVPGGIGLSFTMWQPIDAPPRSRYVVRFYGDFDAAQREAFHLLELNRNPLGVLYRNDRADCP